MDKFNLIYNGDLSKETDGFSAIDLVYDNTQNCISFCGNLQTAYSIPSSFTEDVADEYEISLEIKFNEIQAGKNLYVSLVPLDCNKNEIQMFSVCKHNHRGTETTLAKDLADGDTEAVLTNASAWNGSLSYQNLGICDNIAWDYDRSTKKFNYSSKNGNNIILSQPYSGETIPKGTKVAQFFDAETYFYPIYFTPNETNKEWKSYKATFIGGDNIRKFCRYFYFYIIGYSHRCSVRNMKIRNISSPQICEQSDIKTEMCKTGGVNTYTAKEYGRRIRYIRDSINGSTSNISNHWTEIEAFNHVGCNIAFNKPIKLGNNTTWIKNRTTDGKVTWDDWRDYSGITDTPYITVDLEFIEQITSIKVWHYHYDGHTYYDHVVEVSEDGINWDIVYSGEQQEKEDGIEIKLYPKNTSIMKNGSFHTKNITEI